MHSTQNGDFLQEGLIEFPFPDGATHEDPAVGVSVNGPQLYVGLCLDGGRPGSPVDQSQLTKAPTLTDRAHEIVVDVDLYYM